MLTPEAVAAHPDQVREAVLDELARRRFDFFVRRAWHTYDRRPVIWSWHMQAICDHLQAVAEGRISRLVINIPPRLSKSSLVSVFFPAWLWVRRPETRFLVGSAAQEVVYRDAMKCHEVVDSDWYQSAFNPSWGWNKDQDSKGYFLNTAGGGRISKTIAQKLIGVDADVAIFDDPLDTKGARLTRAALTTHVEGVNDMMGRLTSPNAPVVGVMQRLHENDICGVLEERGGWDHLIIPAEWEGEHRSKTTLGWRDPRKKKGELICNRFTRDYLKERRRALAERGYAAQFQQRPAPASGAIFKKSWFRYWSKETLPTSFDFKIASWDTTFKAGRSNDYCVGQVWGVRGANRYLLEEERARMGYEETIDKIKLQHQRHPGLRATIVEKAATGPAIVESLKHVIPGIVGVSHQGESKESRAEACTPFFAAEQIYFPHPHEGYGWVEKNLVPELLAFPVGRHDDQVDSLTQALIWIDQNRSEKPQVYSLGKRRRRR